MRVSLLALLTLVFFTQSALADPGVGTWTKSNGETTQSVLSGDSVSYAFTTAVNSTVLRVKGFVDVCFDTDTTSVTTGAARVTLRRSVSPSNAVDESALSIAVPFDMSDCVGPLPPATYWVQVDTGRTAAETPIVVVQAR